MAPRSLDLSYLVVASDEHREAWLDRLREETGEFMNHQATFNDRKQLFYDSFWFPEAISNDTIMALKALDCRVYKEL